jgi:RNA polymerase sigma-32 factor
MIAPGSAKHQCSLCGQGHHARHHNRNPYIVPEGEVAFGALDKNQQALAIKYQKLAYKIAYGYRNNPRFEDLVQEGMYGLVIAARRFEPERGWKFATYATYWIRASILNALLRGFGPVRICTLSDQRKVFFNLGKSARRVGDTDEAIAQDLDVSVEDVTLVRQRLSSRSGDYSLDQVAPDAPKRDLVGGSQPDNVFEQAHDDDVRKQQIAAAMRGLSKRERDIIKQRHLSEEPATLQALGGDLGLSRERVRQLELQAFAKIKRVLEADPTFETEGGD